MAPPRKDKSAARWEALASQWVMHLGQFQTARTARAAVSQGKQLLLLKEASPHGTWRDRVNRLGLSERVASSLMAAARRFASAPDEFFTAVGSATKLMELLQWDGAEALARHGESHGITLSQIASMSVAELRAEVRATRDKPATVKPQAPARVPALLSVEEERMLRLFRQMSGSAQQAMFGLAALLAKP